MTTITTAQYHQLLGLKLLADQHSQALEQIRLSALAITGEAEPHGHTADFIFDFRGTGLRRLMNVLDIAVEPEPEPAPYTLSHQPNDAVDELIVPQTSLHLEHMHDDHYWIGLNLPGGQHIRVQIEGRVMLEVEEPDAPGGQGGA